MLHYHRINDKGKVVGTSLDKPDSEYTICNNPFIYFDYKDLKWKGDKFNSDCLGIMT